MSDANFPGRLRAKRKERGLTQEQLAAQLNVTVQAISNWETNKSGASHQNIVALSKVLTVNWGWLGYGEEVDDPDRLVEEKTIEGGYGNSCLTYSREEISLWAQRFPTAEVEIVEMLDLMPGDLDTPYRETLDVRFSPSGKLFATSIITESMRPEFDLNDLIIFDTGIEPAPGDYVMCYNGQSRKVVFRKLRKVTLENGSNVDHLIPLNPDYPLISVNPAKSDRILGTLIEHRRYRKRGFEAALARARAARKDIKDRLNSF